MAYKIVTSTGSNCVIMALLALGNAAITFAAPQITNMRAFQRAGTRLVNINYTLASDTPACEVAVSVSTNNGATYDLVVTNFSGNGYGDAVSPGAGKQIVWNAGTDWKGKYSRQMWLKVTAMEYSTNPLTFTLNTNIFVDEGAGSIWGQPVFDDTNIVVSCEISNGISVRKYDLDLNSLGGFHVVATTNDTDGDRIADHKHVFQNNYHYLVFSISGAGDGGSLWLVKFDRDFSRIGIIQVVTNEPPTNDMLLFGDGESVYVGKFYPEGRAAHKIYKYDGNLNFVTNYLEGTGSNSHANADTAMYLDGLFYFVSPQHVGPGANDKYYRVVYDTNFNVVKSRSIILQDTNKLGVVNGLSYYDGRFIVHYCKGATNANPIARAVFDAGDWSLIQNETIITGGNHASHSVIVSNALYLGFTEENPSFYSKLAKFTISESNPLALVATGVGYFGPIVVDTLGFASIPCDYDGDGKSDLAVFEPGTGYWYIFLSESLLLSVTLYGNSGSTTIYGDYDGDGRTDLTVFDRATGYWYILYSRSFNLAVMKFGNSGCTVISGDYDGDGKTDITVFERATGYWYILYSSTLELVLMPFGNSGCTPVAGGDYDGDGKTDVTVFERATGYWYIFYSSSYTIGLAKFGNSDCTPLMGDFDGDGKADLAVFERSTGYWYILYSDSFTLGMMKFGNSDCTPVPGDYDGDGKTDITVYENATGYWYIFYSSTLTMGVTPFGNANTVPIL